MTSELDIYYEIKGVIILDKLRCCHFGPENWHSLL